MVSHLPRTSRTCMLNLPINEGQGSTAHDSSGFGNHGTVYGATWTKGSYGYGLYFDGTDDYVDCGSDSSLDITDAITVEAWMKFDILPSAYTCDYAYIIGKYGGTYRLFTHKPQGAVSWKISGASGDVELFISETELDTTNWFHIAGTYHKTNGMNVYLNGVNKNTGVQKGAIKTSANDLEIGKYETCYFNGTITEVRIYDRVWTADEVLSYYNATKGRFGL